MRDEDDSRDFRDPCGEPKPHSPMAHQNKGLEGFVSLELSRVSG